MAKSILEALFYGKYIPWDRRVPHSSERNESEKAYLKGKLPTDAHSHLDALETFYTWATTDEEVDIFSRGFIMGVLIMLEVMTGRSEI